MNNSYGILNGCCNDKDFKLLQSDIYKLNTIFSKAGWFWQKKPPTNKPNPKHHQKPVKELKYNNTAIIIILQNYWDE